MTPTLLVHRVALQADGESWSWRFGTGITVLVGPVGVGKSSLLELIKYGLGGNATLTRKVRSVGRRVLIELTLGGRNLVLIRGIGYGANVVQVTDPERGSLGRFAVKADGDTATISDFLLESLGMPRLTVPRSQARPSDKYTRISFNDVYSYLYLDQTEIDRSTIHHLDAVRDVKRRQTFEMLYRLIDAATAQLKVQLADTEAERERVAQRARIVSDFLARSGLPSSEELDRQLALVEATQRHVQSEIQALTSEARRASTAGDRQRSLAAELEARIAAAREEQEVLRVEDEGLRSVQAQLRLDHERTLKAMVAGEVFTAFEYRSCPRCLQPLERHVATGTCDVCLQPDRPVVDGPALDDERLRLEGQLAETDELLTEVAGRAKVLDTGLSDAVALLAAARAEIDRLTAEAVTPFADAQAQLHEELGRMSAQRQALATQRRVGAELALVDSLATTLRARTHELSRELEAAQADLEVGRERVAELSEIFGEIVAGLQLPWAETATVDQRDYLPRIDGERLEMLGSGGMKTIVNIAYFLANLTWSLRDPTALLPRLLIIDSPRKDHGAGEEDLRAADRIYNWMMRLQDTMRRARSVTADQPFQLIIADNDVPEHVRREVRTIELGYDTPLISDASADEPESEAPVDSPEEREG